MAWLVSLLFGFLKSDQSAPARVGGAFNAMAAWGAIAAAIAWLFGPGRVWTIKLDGLELVAVFAVGAIIGHILLSIRPGPPGS